MSEIVIKSVTTGGDNIKGCYFSNITSTTVGFYDKNTTAPGPLNNNVKLKTKFTFALKDHPGEVWTIETTSMAAKKIEGNWSYVSPKEEDGSGSGTFQAQAGGTFAPEPEEAASAKGKAAV